MKRGKSQVTDSDRLRAIRRKLNSGASYSNVIVGVHTWDVAEIFKDFREVLIIARRLSRQVPPCAVEGKKP